MSANIPSVISEIDPFTKLLSKDKQSKFDILTRSSRLTRCQQNRTDIMCPWMQHRWLCMYVWVTYSELISFGIVRGICEVPTQTIVSLEQEHPEGHLKFLLDSAAPQMYKSANPASSHCLVSAMVILAHEWWSCRPRSVLAAALPRLDDIKLQQYSANPWHRLTQLQRRPGRLLLMERGGKKNKNWDSAKMEMC